MERDGVNKSIWQEIGDYPASANHKYGLQYDVVVVGGGITGITTALLLQLKGKKCLVLEAHNLAFGTTGGTTAHLNTFFDTPYYQVAKNFGKQNAQLLADGAKEALDLINKNVNEHHIECEYAERDGYL